MEMVDGFGLRGELTEGSRYLFLVSVRLGTIRKYKGKAYNVLGLSITHKAV